LGDCRKLPGNYSQIIGSLKNRLRKEDLLIEHYVIELSGLGIKIATESWAKQDTALLYGKLQTNCVLWNQLE
jgi:hypothetical protein